tara:strand:+ start:3928 stop:4296 length:369 start_codon:yes stop_codon:yes gene_type:complete
MRDHAETVHITTEDLIDSDVQVTTTYDPLYDIDLTSISSTDTITIDTNTVDTLLTGEDQVYTLTGYNTPVVFEDIMPEVSKVEDMCNEYPALQKAYENFKSIYAMVHQDYVGNRKNEEEVPF